MRAFISLSIVVASLFACNSNTPTPTGSVSTTTSPLATGASALPSLRHNAETVAFRSALVWEEQVGGSVVPQLSLYDRPVACEARLTTNAKRFYAALSGESDHLQAGEFLSPNWGFSGPPHVMAGPDKEGEEKYPPTYWGKVTVTKVTDSAVHGTMHFVAKGLALEGSFEAKRCSR